MKQHCIGMPVVNGVEDNPHFSKTHCKVSCLDSFWESDMASLLEKDRLSRESIGRVFQKVTGAAGPHMHELCSFSSQLVCCKMRKVIEITEVINSWFTYYISATNMNITNNFSGHATWEDLVHYLEGRLDVKENHLVELERLSALPSEGDRVLLIVQEWSRREGKITVSLFHGVSCKLGNGHQVHVIVSELAERDNILPSLPDPLSLSDSGNSQVKVI